MGGVRRLSGPLPTPGRLLRKIALVGDGYIRHSEIVLSFVLNFRASRGLDRSTRREGKKSACVPRLAILVGHAMAMHWPGRLPGIEFGVRSELWTSRGPARGQVQLVPIVQLGH